jgi:hypothetical protein
MIGLKKRERASFQENSRPLQTHNGHPEEWPPLSAFSEARFTARSSS